MTIRLIRSATVARLEREIEFLKRDLAAVVIHRDLVQEQLERAHRTIRELTELRHVQEDLGHALNAIGQCMSLLGGDPEDDPREETRH